MLGQKLIQPSSVTEGFDFGILPPPAVEALWPDIATIIKKHPPRPGCELFATTGDIKQSLLEGHAYLWAGLQDRQLELILICCFKIYPTTRTMEVLYVGGKGLRRAFYYWPNVESWAAKCGATHIEARISRAMKRFYSSMGVKEVALYYRKPLLSFAN